jgi:sulfur relay (sulfurtransferase) complex TusBCD TusD component (DsrE family)
MSKMTIIMSEPPFEHERAYLAMRLILGALHERHEVEAFLIENAVTGCGPEEGPRESAADQEEKKANCLSLVRAVLEMGALVKVCLRGEGVGTLDQDALAEGVVPCTMKDLVRSVSEADRVISF